jgi:hypothetical protein
LTAQLKAAFDTGVSLVRTVGGAEGPDALPRTVYPSGVHASREALFGQYVRFGLDVSALCAGFDIALAVLQLFEAPRRGSELDEACAPARKSLAALGAAAEQTVAACKSHLGDRGGGTVLQNDLELLFLAAEILVHPALIVRRLVDFLTMPKGLKENKQLRQTRNALLALLGDTATVLRAPLTELSGLVTTLSQFEVGSSEGILKEMQAVGDDEPRARATCADIMKSRAFSLTTLKDTLTSMLTLVKSPE